jgi:hypothetical protein
MAGAKGFSRHPHTGRTDDQNYIHDNVLINYDKSMLIELYNSMYSYSTLFIDTAHQGSI